MRDREAAGAAAVGAGAGAAEGRLVKEGRTVS